MGFIGGLFSGGKGADFSAQSAPVSGMFDATGAQAGVQQSQNAYKQQQSLLDALNAQNGIGNQNQVFNQLQGVANGTGPNPAQAMLNQATGQNVANQAALMASQRGASANPGMMARQAAQQGANIQQNAAGQGATMEANQRLAALGQLQGLANQQAANQIGGVGAVNSTAQGLENLYNQGLANQNNANVAMTSNQNTSNAHIAGANQGTQSGILGSMASGLGGGIGKIFGGGGGGDTSAPNGNSVAAVGGPTQSTANSGQNIAHGGMVKRMADGGIITPDQSTPPQYSSYLANSLNGTKGSESLIKDAEAAGEADNEQPRSPGWGGGLPGLGGLGGLGGMNGQGGLGVLGGLFGAITGPNKAAATDASGNPMPTASGAPSSSGSYNPQSGAGSGQAGKPPPLPGGFSKGGKVPAKVSPGEIYLSPDKAKAVAKGKASPFEGERIKGKAKVKGDSYANDTVAKTLQEGGVVIPRSKALGDDVARKAQEFVAAVMAKQGIKGKR